MFNCFNKYEIKVKSSILAYNRRETPDKRPLGRTRTGASVTVTL